MVGHQMDCVEEEEMAKVHTIAPYIALYHIQTFIKSPLAPCAPLNTLTFLHNMRREAARPESDLYRDVVRSLLGQCWYLDQPWVPLALTDRNLTTEEKEKLSTALLLIPRPSTFPPCPVDPLLPKLPCHQDTFWPEDGSLPSLVGLLGPRSWQLFHILDLGGDEVAWLGKPSSEWEDSPGFTRFKEFVENLTIVNDSAERSVKLIQDFVTSSTDEDIRQDLLVSISENRKSIGH